MTTSLSMPGAAPATANIQNLQTEYPNLRVVKLEQNYRSSQRILPKRKPSDQKQYQAVRQKPVERTRSG